MGSETVSVGGQQVSYRASAGSGRPVVFVHGNSASSRTWEGVLEGSFGRRFRCLAIDLPGHGDSPPAADQAVYSLPGYARVVAEFAAALGVADAVFVGWSLGGHIVLEAAPNLPSAAGFVIFGTPPVSSPADMANAFLPNPVMNVGFTAEVSPDDARAYAASFTAPGSTISLESSVADILRTDGAARACLFASIGAGQAADEVAIAGSLPVPLAILHGEQEQLVSLPYIKQLTIPSLWRGAVQLIPGVGHAPQLEDQAAFEALLTEFIEDLG
ncbi:MAG TPA: alpha/beta hydrolase [Streptosporangiaceae bacterium]|nr:alpha/beta hydrolase [Streptosporangiaceae bacterium]